MFRIKENGSTFITEVLAGITTFVTMSYIIRLVWISARSSS